MFRIVASRLLRTKEISDVLRILSDFRVSRLTIVDEAEDEELHHEISSIFNYAFTPPYLKKYVGMSPYLTKAGVLAPMDVSHHKVPEFPVEGDVRLSRKGDMGIKGCIGYDGYVMIVDSIECRSIQYPSVFYTGPELHFEKIDSLEKKNNLIIASRSGANPFLEKARILNTYERNGISLLIGPPDSGVLKLFPGSPIFNFIPKQGTANVRSKEALVSALVALNYILL